MPHDPRKCLEDLFQAGCNIQEIAKDRTLADYEADVFFRAAVERFFEIIGEAITRLGKIDPALAGRIPDHRKIVSFRNVLSHGYDSIKAGEVWQIVEHDLPGLLAVVDSLRANFPV